MSRVLSEPGTTPLSVRAAVASPPGRTISPLGTLLRFGAVFGQFLCVVWLIKSFRLENPAVWRLLDISIVGFVVHHFLPNRLRPALFLGVSLAALLAIFCVNAENALVLSGLQQVAWLLGLGLVLIGICHLPLRFWPRAGLLVAVGIVLALVRISSLGMSHLGPVWPILGSLFMFRLMVYLYDLEHDNQPRNVIRSLSYFFLLPNFCFPLFPVIDYKTFCRSHYNADPLGIYQKGLDWMVRGALHLVLYRLVYYHYYIDTAKVAYGSDVTLFMVTNVLLYLRVSGQFHLAIGLLHLFGFNLPETNRKYFLASSFTDYWRRVNIYWKDFILKLFYYPTSFRLKRWGPVRALVAATAFCFLVTWFLHAYQTFWISGRFQITAQDSVFWGVLGLLVVANSLCEATKGRKRTLGKQVRTWRDRAGLAARTGGTFLVLTILWSIWSADSMENWVRLWTVADWSTAAWALLVLCIIMSSALVFDGPWQSFMKLLTGVDESSVCFTWRRAVVTCLVPALCLLSLTRPRITSQFGESTASLIATLRGLQANEYDEDVMERGYYEDLMDLSRSNPQLDQLLRQRPATWLKLEQTDAVVSTGDYRMKELIPSKKTMVNGWTLTTNRWGLRDRDYPLEKPTGTFRIVLLGASTAMGWGVEDHETFEELLEQRLNRQPLSAHARYEVLNFGMNGYSSTCNLIVLDKKALAFRPDAVLVLANSTDEYWARQRLAKSVRASIEPPYDYLRELIKKTEIDGRMPEQAALRRLEPYGRELVTWGYTQVAERARDSGAVPIWFMHPSTSGNKGKNKQMGELQFAAQSAGYVILDVDDTYQNQATDAIVLAPWDYHPNKMGHALLADCLYEALGANSQRVFGSEAKDPPSTNSNQP